MATEENFQFDNVGEFARKGVLQTRAGKVLTPTFMPDGTRGAVKSLTPEQVQQTGVQVVLANTYHLHMQPGEDVITELGGIHEFSKQSLPILTDSGGFQVFSLAKIREITEHGVTFKDPKTGDVNFLSPETSIQIQMKLGADLMVAFDDVTALDDLGRGRTKEAFERTHRWLERSLAEFQRLTKEMKLASSHTCSKGSEQRSAAPEFSSTNQLVPTGTPDQLSETPGTAARSSSGHCPKCGEKLFERPLLFGVVQGGLDKELREKSLEIVQSLPVDGIAIGGLSVGETREEMHEMLDYLAPLYDNSNRPRFLLGVGDPVDLRKAIETGIDMLDCVLPTRNARHATAWITGDKKIHLTNQKFAKDTSPLDVGCDCTTCQTGYSRGFLRHQFKVGESLAGTLVSIHNIRYLQRICEEYRK